MYLYRLQVSFMNIINMIIISLFISLNIFHEKDKNLSFQIPIHFYYKFYYFFFYIFFSLFFIMFYKTNFLQLKKNFVHLFAS